MWKRGFKFSACLGICMLVVFLPFLHSQKLKFGLGAAAGYMMPSSDNYTGGLKFGGNINVIVSRNIAFEINGFSSQREVEGSPDLLSKGTLTVNPLGVNLQVRFPVGDRSSPNFVPYIVGGGNYCQNTFNLDDQITSNWNNLGFNVEESVENGIGFNIGAGLDYFVSENFAINVDGRYYINNSKGNWSLTDQKSNGEVSGSFDEINLNSIFIGLGLKYFFSL